MTSEQIANLVNGRHFSYVAKRNRLFADDILQESRLKLWQNRHKLPTDENERASFVWTIVRRTAIDFKRTNRRNEFDALPSTEIMSKVDNRMDRDDIVKLSNAILRKAGSQARLLVELFNGELAVDSRPYKNAHECLAKLRKDPSILALVK